MKHMHVIKPAGALFIIAALTTVLLSLAYTLTLEPIEQKTRAMQEKTMKEILTLADDFKEIPAEISGSMVRVFEGTAKGETIGYIIELAPEGYSGAISMMVGVSTEEGEDALAGMRVLKHTETPGLGALAVKESFYKQYDNKRLTPLKVVKFASAHDEIDSITSSTITTKAITDAVNEAIEWYNGGSWR